MNELYQAQIYACCFQQRLLQKNINVMVVFLHSIQRLTEKLCVLFARGRRALLTL